jgi:transposase
MSKLKELIQSKTKLPKKPERCWKWLGKIGSDGFATLKIKTKSGKKSIDVARFNVASQMGRKLDDGEALRRLELCTVEGCTNPDHFGVVLVAARDERFKGDEVKISHFKRQIAAGARVRATAKKFGLSASWAYQIANGERYAEVEPKGAVLVRVKKTLTAEEVELAKRLRTKKKWTYQQVADKLGCHYSTAREACLIVRPSWQASDSTKGKRNAVAA